MKLERTLKILFLLLAIFDFILATFLIFFGGVVFAALNLSEYAQPRFFMICVGLFLYQYTYIQFMGFKNPRKYATCLNMTVLIRLSFPFVYVAAILLWGAPYTLLHLLLGLSAVADLAISAFIMFAMNRLNIAFFGGDETSVPDNRGPRMLRGILLILAIAEFVICWNWLLFPKFWLQYYQVSYTLDPFWTRATGVLLLNIAYIQFLGFLNVYRYRQAVITSGIFRALWPSLYWYWAATGGEGSGMFKLSILFFSVFDTIACIVIFSLLKRAMSKIRKLN